MTDIYIYIYDILRNSDVALVELVIFIKCVHMPICIMGLLLNNHNLNEVVKGIAII